MESRNEDLADRVEQRRSDVFALHFAQGFTISTIAKLLNVPRSVIEDDVSATRMTEANTYKDADLMETLAVDAAVLRHVRELALGEFNTTIDTVAKHEFLKTAILATDTRWHLLAAIFDVRDSRNSDLIADELEAVEDEELEDAEEHIDPQSSSPYEPHP